MLCKTTGAVLGVFKGHPCDTDMGQVIGTSPRQEMCHVLMCGLNPKWLERSRTMLVFEACEGARVNAGPPREILLAKGPNRIQTPVDTRQRPLKTDNPWKWARAIEKLLEEETSYSLAQYDPAP